MSNCTKSFGKKFIWARFHCWRPPCVVPPESSDGEKMVQFGWLVKSDKFFVRPMTSVANFILCYTSAVYILLESKDDKNQNQSKKSDNKRKFKMHLDAIRNASQYEQSIKGHASIRRPAWPAGYHRMIPAMPPDGTGGTVRTRKSGHEDRGCQDSVTPYWCTLDPNRSVQTVWTHRRTSNNDQYRFGPWSSVLNLHWNDGALCNIHETHRRMRWPGSQQ